MKNPTGTVMYLIEQAIKEYRKLSQKNVALIVKDITIDQCIVLMILNKDCDVTQNELAHLVFKDSASITRMIELMVKNGYLSRAINVTDRRKYTLQVTIKGKKTLDSLNPVIKKNRETAMKDLSQKEIDTLDEILTKIIGNCKD